MSKREVRLPGSPRSTKSRRCRRAQEPQSFTEISSKDPSNQTTSGSTEDSSKDHVAEPFVKPSTDLSKDPADPSEAVESSLFPCVVLFKELSEHIKADPFKPFPTDSLTIPLWILLRIYSNHSARSTGWALNTVYR